MLHISLRTHARDIPVISRSYKAACGWRSTPIAPKPIPEGHCSSGLGHPPIQQLSQRAHAAHRIRRWHARVSAPMVR